jgi:DNA-directed RNA polymerase subunit RPC12/RpoP
MNIEDLKKDLEKGNSGIYKGLCHDCGTEVIVKAELAEDGTITVAGGAVYKVKQQYARVDLFYKCDACFAKNRILEEYKECDVFSRVVGYLRPVNQWNAGKKAEMDMRVEFTNVRNK